MNLEQTTLEKQQINALYLPTKQADLSSTSYIYLSSQSTIPLNHMKTYLLQHSEIFKVCSKDVWRISRSLSLHPSRHSTTKFLLKPFIIALRN